MHADDGASGTVDVQHDGLDAGILHRGRKDLVRIVEIDAAIAVHFHLCEAFADRTVDLDHSDTAGAFVDAFEAHLFLRGFDIFEVVHPFAFGASRVAEIGAGRDGDGGKGGIAIHAAEQLRFESGTRRCMEHQRGAEKLTEKAGVGFHAFGSVWTVMLFCTPGVGSKTVVKSMPCSSHMPRTALRNLM